MRRLVCATLLIAGSALWGCASTATRSLSETVDGDVVRYFPPEGRRWTYEAENEVIIALDRLDSARDHLAEIDMRVEDMDDAYAAVSERGGAGREVAEAKMDWLKLRRDHAYAQIAVAELNVLCSRARLELTKAQLAVRFDLPVEENFVEPFETQHSDCEEDLEGARTRQEELFQSTLTAKDNWRNVRSSYAQKTGDFHHGLWID